MTKVERHHLWVFLPAKAFRVRARIAATGSLDRLEKTVLELLRIRPRDVNGLVRLLGFDPEQDVDLVRSALHRLSGIGLAAPAGASDSWETVAVAAEEEPAATLPGWVLLSPRGKLVPRVWIGESTPPVADEKDTVTCPRESAGIPEPKPDDLQLLLDGLCLQDDVQCLTCPDAAGEVEIVEEPLSALLLGRGRSRDTQCRCLVELVPRVSGLPEVLIHEPDLVMQSAPEGVGAMPISGILDDWMRVSCPQAWEAIERKMGELVTQSSIVLRLAGIHDEKAFRDLVERHRTERSAALGAIGIISWDSPVGKWVGQAQEYLLLSQKDGRYQQIARFYFGLAVEALLKQLAGEVRASLEHWVGAFCRWGGKTERYAQREGLVSQGSARLRRFGLAGRIGRSEEHLIKALKGPEGILETIKRLREEKGTTGDYLSLWLLGAVIPESEDEAEQHAARVSRAIGKDAELFNKIDLLIRLRNDVFHDNRGREIPVFMGQAEFLEERFLQVWVALESSTLAA